ncbi:MAG: alpha/beta fold hydrolase [Stappiaceae bacterium]
MQEGFALGADGVSLSYSVTGSGPWLVLSNSLATNKEMWQPQLAEFAKSYTVLTYDTRGHGMSGTGNAPYNFSVLASDVVAIMTKLNIASAKFLGLSLGGMTGLALALEHPEKLDSLVCCDARADAPEPYKAIWDQNITRLHEGGMSAIADGTLARWFSTPFNAEPENAETIDKIRRMILSTPPEGYEAAARCLQSLDLLKDLSQITVPTSYIVGEFDMAAPLSVMQDMASRTSGGTLRTIPGAAHLSNVEKPNEFLSAALDCLNA